MLKNPVYAGDVGETKALQKYTGGGLLAKGKVNKK